MYIGFLLLCYKMTKARNKFKKAKRIIFVLPNANMPHQHRQLTKKMFAVLLLVTVSSIKSEAATGGVL